MITLPPHFAETKYPGYFFNTEDQQLYSLKVDGILKPLAKVFPNPRFNMIREPGYRVSVKGRYRFLPMSYLKSLKLGDGEIPVGRRETREERIARRMMNSKPNSFT